MSDFEHFAALFGNLIDSCRCHNESWDLPSEQFAAACGAAWKSHGSAS
ncbi:hypothetical protein [Paraburkholderia domus]|nr:hypothetical protein [Paraburkholderia domus]MBK5047986.1 hypothetical protein [Burkholderia sp. R-70006]MBK5063202.1 hypothetical protein [Burkholderia sp. R-70199]MBK5084511.1 hypothetical protein [Burkholderia sp. R-69927]MBK5123063.1 hypothetical protein [Burkholderia sp. R-69980]MBK5163552.1 hypothetical protein [Burkholderia sp. R-70211]MBK5180271.1 hypothetical protein [Burkholderia sp. R-69749]MCI0148142.1 hypothetical protein [Paraburkholderia sediminicola]